jgi:hypothetical protein
VARTSIGAAKKTGPAWWLIGAATMGAVALGGAAFLLTAFIDPTGPVAGAAPLAAAAEMRAASILNRADPSPADVRLAEAAARRALAIAPTHAAAWLDLAYIDRLRHGRLTPAGVAALQRSYDFEPLGPDVSPWRIRFTHEHWTEVGPELRRQAIKETESLWTAAGGAETLSAMPARITDGPGRMALTLTVARLAAMRRPVAEPVAAAPAAPPAPATSAAGPR